MAIIILQVVWIVFQALVLIYLLKMIEDNVGELTYDPI